MGREPFLYLWARGGPTAWFVLACWGTFLLYWLVSAFSVKRVAVRPGWRRFAWRLPILLALAVLIVLARSGFARTISGDFRLSLWRPDLATGLIGDIVTLAGLLVALWARRTLAGNWSSEPLIREGHELVERGPYARVRHPIYSGLILMVLGGALLSGRLGAVFVFLLVVSGLWLKARLEERILMQHFPDTYPAYKRRTKALIPFIL